MFSLGSMMGMMGGAPVVKSGDVFINKLKAAKVMEMGDSSDTQIEKMAQGLKGLLQNPMQGKGGNAKQASQAASNRLTTQDVAKTKTAIDGTLIATIDAVMAEADKIVGRDEGETGLLDTVSVIQSLSGIGVADPRYSEASILKPALTDDEMDHVASEVTRIANDVATGVQTDISGAQAINSLAIPLIEILNKAQAARQLADRKAVYLASANAAGALLTAGSPEWQEVMEKAWGDKAATMKARNIELITPDPDDIVVST